MKDSLELGKLSLEYCFLGCLWTRISSIL